MAVWGLRVFRNTGKTQNRKTTTAFWGLFLLLAYGLKLQAQALLGYYSFDQGTAVRMVRFTGLQLATLFQKRDSGRRNHQMYSLAWRRIRNLADEVGCMAFWGAAPGPTGSWGPIRWRGPGATWCLGIAARCLACTTMGVVAVDSRPQTGN